MKILHITPHLGGGVGTVLMDWMDKVIPRIDQSHEIVCLDYANQKAMKWAKEKLDYFPLVDNMGPYPSLWMYKIEDADIVLCHYWDHPMLADLFADHLPDCRLVFWCHKNIPYSPEEIAFPDLWIDTSPIQGHGRHIWSTGDISRFPEIQPKPHKGFVVGYVGTISYKKIHPEWYPMCVEIKKAIPDARFTFIGENLTAIQGSDWMTFTGKVDDVVPYLAEMDVFGYPLRPDHYGTCEQALGEAMAAGVVPVVMDNRSERHIVQSSMLNGFRAKTPKDYINCIEILYHDPDLRRIMAHNARSTATAIYDINTMIDCWDETFNEVMQKPRRERRPI